MFVNYNITGNNLLMAANKSKQSVFFVRGSTVSGKSYDRFANLDVICVPSSQTVFVKYPDTITETHVLKNEGLVPFLATEIVEDFFTLSDNLRCPIVSYEIIIDELADLEEVVSRFDLIAREDNQEIALSMDTEVGILNLEINQKTYNL